MIRKLLAPIIDKHANLQERMFCLMTYIGLVALTILLLVRTFMGDHYVDLLIHLVLLVLIMTITALSIHYHKINAGAVTNSVVVTFLFLPSLFFTSSGMNGGAPLWFVFCCLYVCLVLTGKVRVFFLMLAGVVTFLCYYVSFYNPEYVKYQTEISSYLDSALSVILVSAMASIMIIFQNRIYIEQNKLTEKQKKEIKALNQAQNRFFSSMSHEIRTPINTIIGLNEMILRGDISDEIAEDARSIQGASKMLLTLIYDILDLSKLESGKMDIIPVTYETGAFFSEIVNMIWIRAKEKGLEFHLSIEPSMPSMLCGDEVRIKQVLVNILNNAVKYTKEGSITLAVWCKRIGPNRVLVSYEIADTGSGIKKENIPHLFEAFRRVDEKKNRYIEGTGLGLSIVKQLVDLMNGQITVNSVYTKGSTFLVTLEQEIIDEKELGAFSMEKRIRQGLREEYKQSFEAPTARILIVDDNKMNLTVAKKLLSDTKVRVDTVTSAAECLVLAENIQYDCILMDHLMPEMDGIECLHALRKQSGGACRETPVIALTANAGGDMQQLYRREGFSGYLAKPVSGALLEAAVMRILPEEKVTLCNVGEEEEGTDEHIMLRGRKQRIPIMITTDSVSDIPKELIEHFNILSVLPYYVNTKEGRFLDEVELESDDLLIYMADKRKEASPSSPDISDYEQFFAQKLTEAQNVIHISIARFVGNGYENACAAAESFENVTVIDSGHLSCGMGLFVLYAAQLASEELPIEDLIRELSGLSEHISSSYLVAGTKALLDTGRVSKIVQRICETLMVHPVFELKKSRLIVGAVEVGRQEHVIKRYIKHTLKNRNGIDKSVIFISYAGMDDETLRVIRELVRQQCPFRRVYIQKTVPSISCNCGAGTFGLSFMKKVQNGGTS